MGLENPKAGFNGAAEFMVSGLPWVTSSVSSATPQRWDFPKVSRSITVRTSGSSNDAIAIGFTRNGVASSNRFVLQGNASETFEVRVKELWIVATAGTPSYSVLAGLTNIDASQMPVLSGSASGSFGWSGIG